jgi:hypothetical protein
MYLHQPIKFEHMYQASILNIQPMRHRHENFEKNSNLLAFSTASSLYILE